MQHVRILGLTDWTDIWPQTNWLKIRPQKILKLASTFAAYIDPTLVPKREQRLVPNLNLEGFDMMKDSQEGADLRAGAKRAWSLLCIKSRTESSLCTGFSDDNALSSIHFLVASVVESLIFHIALQLQNLKHQRIRVMSMFSNLDYNAIHSLMWTLLCIIMQYTVIMS